MLEVVTVAPRLGYLEFSMETVDKQLNEAIARVEPGGWSHPC